MYAYILKRLLLMIPTLFGIVLVSFLIVQAAPGGPVEQAIAEITGMQGSATERIAGGGHETMGGAGMLKQANSTNTSSKYRGAQGLDPELIARI
ncbi:MAG: hypothetical protein KDD76_00275, partial [Rickettsiales bacterium]|nr:hypothetical protein [Rickettsiales bacterium]